MSFGLSPLFLRPLARVLARIDVDGHRFLTHLGIDDATPSEIRVDAGRVDRALDLIAAELQDQSFGITLAQNAVSHPLGFFDHLVWPGVNVRAALQRSVRFYGLLTNRSTMSLDEHAEGARLTQHVCAGAPRGTVLTEMAFSSLVLRARGAADGFEVRAMHFAHPAPAMLGPHLQTFGPGVTFDAPYDAMELERSQLDRPLGTADSVVAAALEAQALALPGAQRSEPFLDEVRSVLRRTLLDPEPAVARVSRALGLAETDVQARLEERGATLAELGDDVRRDVAISLLERGIALADVASSIGMTNLQTFHDAFVRWTTVAPGTWRTH